MKTLFPFLLINFLSIAIFAQSKAGIRYTADYRFERGVYPTLEDWKQQNPVKPSEIIVDIDARSPKFFQYLLLRESFRYPRDNKIVHKKPSEIFGYSPDGEKLFYGTDYQFEVVGAICLLKEVGQVDTYSSFVNPGEQYEAAREVGSGKLYMLDFATGDFSKLKPRALKAVLKKDPDLYQRYRKAKGGKKEKMRAFIKEYNFNHPIYFPKD